MAKDGNFFAENKQVHLKNLFLYRQNIWEKMKTKDQGNSNLHNAIV